MNIINGLELIKGFQEVHVEDSKVKRRSSVAIIIRFPGINLDHDEEDQVLPRLKQSSISDLNNAEMLFIKRAASERDRWSSHIALPGGKRDAEDVSDVDVAIRETWEEVGLNLYNNGTYIGPLDQRLVKVSWGSRVAMTLCPYVFVLTNSDAKLDISQDEVATAFWYPLRNLLDFKYSSTEHVAVGDRMGLSKYWFIPDWLNSFIKSNVGNMTFQCIDLFPTKLEGNKDLEEFKFPFKLWGLTLAYMVDFFELIQPGHAIEKFQFPTMDAFDMRLLIALLSFTHRKKTKQSVRDSIDGYKSGQMDFVSKMLDGYFWYLKRGIAATMGLRLIVVIGAIILWLKKFRK